MLYETVGNIIYSIHDNLQKVQWIEASLKSYSPFWMSVINNIQNASFFEDNINCQTISFFIKINSHLSDTIGAGYIPFF